MWYNVIYLLNNSQTTRKDECGFEKQILLLQHGTVRSEVEEGRNFWYKRRRLEERLSPARSHFLHAIFIMLVIAATIHDQTGPMRQWNKRWRTTPDLEFVKKFTRPNFPVKEFYTLKTRKSRLFSPTINSKNTSLSVIWPSFG